ncbi:MAG TPA: Crp/Fnr family transcriptional regulator [Gammaproteobacteria bacterium]|nr:Crp/Fnr family transcriptional regulator [Gammaproteobacteria bacterium]
MSLPAGTVIAEPGVECTRLALLLGGRVRVYKLAESGREITLYRIHAGESCVLTASCILNMTNFTALAVVESAVEAVILPAGLVRQWLDRYAPWRAFVFGLINQRLEDLMTTIDQVAFRRMDARIADWLMTAKNSAGRVETTHQRIADDLGTSREVVSRILKDFEQDGAIDLSRGEVWLRNMDLLPSRFNSGT